MKSSTPTLRLLASLLAVVMALPGAPAFAKSTPNELTDLIGAKGAGGEAELERRGYTHIDTSKSSSAAFSYWWNRGSKQCVRVKTADGRYQEIVQVSASDCNQSPDRDSGASTGAKVAVGAAALLGIAALAHKSHHRDDKDYDERQTAAFERGYRDGLYSNSYHNYDNSREYSSGYSKGTEERGERSGYRGNSYHRGGYDAHVNINDLRYRSSSDAREELDRRGFRMVSERPYGDHRAQRYFWNGSTRQCVNMEAQKGEVVSLYEVSASSCDR